jgi:hypothetical protein
VKKNSSGKEFSLSVNASNVYITDLNLTDKYRAAKLKVASSSEERRQNPRKASKPTM